MILYITQNSFYFNHRHFLNFYEEKNCEVIYVSEKKRGLIKKYKEILFYFGLINCVKSIFLEFKYYFNLHRRASRVNSNTVIDRDLNKVLKFKLKSGIFKEIISIGCPCIINCNLQERFNIKILNLHGGIIPFQTGRFSPIKSLKKGHEYLGSTLHIISNEFDNGEIISQDFFKIKNKNILNNYNHVLSISSKLLQDYHLGKKRKIPKEVLTKLNNG